MTLIRVIVIGLIIFLLVRAFKRWQENKVSSLHGQQQDEQQNQDMMVPCKVCKLHIPEKDALKKEGNYYCCQEHLEQDNS